jgi:mannose-1-phosphate guanylyltransferase
VVEPEIKNTAACLTLAAAIVAARDPDGVLVAEPADHWVSDASAFRQSLRAAVSAAVRHQTIATIGIRPTSPDPGLGYLCARAGHLVRFIEKPPRAVAARLVRRPGTYWNSGMFVSPVQVLLDLVARNLPAHARRLAPLGQAWGTRSFAASARRAYRGLDAVSFDHGVMAHVQNGIVVEGRFGWTDLGSWDAWAKAGRSSARTLSVGSQRVTVVGNHRHLVATIGVRDLVVVHTPSATLICPPSHAQRVREIVKQLWQDPQWAPYR